MLSPHRLSTWLDLGVLLAAALVAAAAAACFLTGEWLLGAFDAAPAIGLFGYARERISGRATP